jgi:hypothetical protein
MNKKLLQRLRKLFNQHGLWGRHSYEHSFEIHLWSPQVFGKENKKAMKVLQLGIKAGLVRRERLPQPGWGKNERRYFLIPEEIRHRIGVPNE